MLDVARGAYVEDAAIAVAGDRIAFAGRRAELRVKAGARVVELPPDAVAMPGLIDAHVHLALGGADRDGAAKTLRAGFTTVRDLGSTGGAGIALRDAIARGETVGPRMIVAGAGIGGPGGACDGAAGVPVALGTDAIVIPHGDNARELGALVEAGLSPAAAIRAATIDAARLLDVPAGTLAAGALADVIAVRGDPLANVAVLRDVVFVMKSGTQVRD